MISDSFCERADEYLKFIEFCVRKIKTKVSNPFTRFDGTLKTINVKGFSNLSSKHLGVICEMTQQICGHVVVFGDVTNNFVEQKCDQNLK